MSWPTPASETPFGLPLAGGNDLQPKITRLRVDLDQERVKNAKEPLIYCRFLPGS
jgi:hypothetical protein